MIYALIHEFDELMLSISEHDEIFNSIIEAIPIDMVNMLISVEASLKKLLHQIAMLSKLASIDVEHSILMFSGCRWFESECSKLREMNFCETFSRTIFSPVSLGLILRDIKKSSTATAIENYPLFLSAIGCVCPFISARNTAKFRSFMPFHERNSADRANSRIQCCRFNSAWNTAKFRFSTSFLE